MITHKVVAPVSYALTMRGSWENDDFLDSYVKLKSVLIIRR